MAIRRKLTNAERSAIARKAANARWAKQRARSQHVYATIFADHMVRKMVNVVDGQIFRWAPLSQRHATPLWPGNVLYAFHVDRRRLCAIAKMRIAYTGLASHWNHMHATRDPVPVKTGWEEVIIGTEGTPVHFYRPLPDDVVRALRFEASAIEKLNLDDDARLIDRKRLEGYLRLTPESVDELTALTWI